MGFTVAFSMLPHSLHPSCHSKVYTQFATIPKQQSVFSNVYMASSDAVDVGVISSLNSQTNAFVTTCPTNSPWFVCWSASFDNVRRMDNDHFNYKHNNALLNQQKDVLNNNIKNYIPEDTGQCLCHRFDDLPIHEACYDVGIDLDKLEGILD
jgi:hypothetical protein